MGYRNGEYDKKNAGILERYKNINNFTRVEPTLMKIYTHVVPDPLNIFQLIIKVDLL